MALVNGSFELEGAQSGDASDWAVTVTSNGEEYADFGDDGQETFEDWAGALIAAFTGYLIDITPAFFDGSANEEVENFDDLWGNTPAVVVTTVDPPWDLTGSPTITLRVDGGALQTVTLSPSWFFQAGSARAEELAIAITAQVTEASAGLNQAGTAVRLVSDSRGQAASIQIVGGTAIATVGLAPSTATGEDKSGPFIAVLGGALAEFTGGAQHDNFEEWSGAIDLTSDPDDTSARLAFADFDGATVAHEDFEDNWGSFDDTPDPTDTLRPPTFASFTGPADHEDYEGTWTAMTTI